MLFVGNFRNYFSNPLIPRKKILGLHVTELKRTYRFLPERSRINLGYVLLATLDRCERAGDKERAAHMAYLVSYYMSELLSPPGAKQLALRYAEKAVRWNPMKRYEEWKAFVLESNRNTAS